MSKRLMERKEGSALIGAIIIALIVGVWVSMSVSSTFTESKMSKRHFDMQNAMNLAESGLEEGVRIMQAKSWAADGWTSYGDGYYKSFAPVVSDGMTSTIKVFVKDDPSDPQILAEGSVTDGQGLKIRKQVKVEMAIAAGGGTKTVYTAYANAMLAKREVIFNGNHVLVDSYDSRLGDWTEVTEVNRFSNGHVVSLAVENPQVLINNADVRGRVSVGSDRWSDNLVGPQGTVHAYGYVGPRVDPTRITTDFFADVQLLPWPSAAEVAGFINLNTLNTTKTLGSPLATEPTGYRAERVQLNDVTITIDGPVVLYVERNFDMGGQAEIKLTENGSLRIYVREAFKIAGKGASNASKDPARLEIIGGDMADQSIQLGGNAQLYAVVHAPNGVVHMNGGGSSGVMCGAIVASQITLNGHWGFHYDEALRGYPGGGEDGAVEAAGRPKIERWRELRTAAEMYDFSDPAAIAASF